MILYFSGTGNSKFVAEEIASVTDDRLVSINQSLGNNSKALAFQSSTSFVFVLPIYAWRIPRVVSDWIESTDFSGTRQVYFITTCGDSAGNAQKYIKQLCQKKDWELQGYSSIVMPENYIALFQTPTPKEARSIIYRALPDILGVAQYIKYQRPFFNYEGGGRFLSTIINPLFYKLFVHANSFFTMDGCTSCGTCVQLCPLNNVQLIDGLPTWGKNCTHCMACINKCPEKTIEYGKGTRNKVRYSLNQSTKGKLGIHQLLKDQASDVLTWGQVCDQVEKS